MLKKLCQRAGKKKSYANMQCPPLPLLQPSSSLTCTTIPSYIILCWDLLRYLIDNPLLAGSVTGSGRICLKKHSTQPLLTIVSDCCRTVLCEFFVFVSLSQLRPYDSPWTQVLFAWFNHLPSNYWQIKKKTSEWLKCASLARNIFALHGLAWQSASRHHGMSWWSGVSSLGHSCAFKL